MVSQDIPVSRARSEQIRACELESLGRGEWTIQYNSEMMDNSSGESARRGAKVAVGRRTFFSLAALGATGVLFGNGIQRIVGDVFGSGVANLLPGGSRFRFYTITGSSPVIKDQDYRLQVSDLVHHPMTFTLADLKAMPATDLTATFQCVTGWTVPGVTWKGVQLSHILDLVGVKPEAIALQFESYDGADTESLLLDQARLPTVLVAYEMLGARVTTDHGGPVRLYVAPMYGYKSLKWLSAIRVIDQVKPGYWEQNGYPTNGWRDGTTGPTNPSPSIL